MTELKYTWLVEVGKDKGSYKNRYQFKNDLGTPSGRPALYYFGLNIHSGFKKRLVRVTNSTGERKIVYREIS